MSISKSLAPKTSHLIKTLNLKSPSELQTPYLAMQIVMVLWYYPCFYVDYSGRLFSKVKGERSLPRLQEVVGSIPWLVKVLFSLLSATSREVKLNKAELSDLRTFIEHNNRKFRRYTQITHNSQEVKGKIWCVWNKRFWLHSCKFGHFQKLELRHGH